MTAIGPLAMILGLFAAAWVSDRRTRRSVPLTAADHERYEDEESRWVEEQARADREHEQAGDSYAHGGPRQTAGRS
jgi:hypothetical protein